MKNLSLPLVSVLLGGTLPAVAAVRFELSTTSEYRQTESDGLYFRGGSMFTDLEDGVVFYIAGCIFTDYLAPGGGAPCGAGTTGYVTSGELGGASILTPYITIASIVPAIVIEPRRPELVKLTAAPASLLERPSGGFSDSSFALYYNLTALSVKEYIVTNYYNYRNYGAGERKRFDGEIVPGVYFYAFPKLNNPTLPATIAATINPMAGGLQELNNKLEGFEFTELNKNVWTKNGFVELSFRRPNTIKWRQLSPSNTFTTADTLSFSMRELFNPGNPKSEAFRGTSIFPDFTDAVAEPKIPLANPFVTSYTVPPIFPSSTRGIIELELQRSLGTGGVTFDYSWRRFQIPFIIIDFYREYADQVFANQNQNTGILADFDNDGYNNLTEWILESNARSKADIPLAPRPVPVTDDPLDPIPYFGFTIEKKMGTDPNVRYILERSKNNGKTWAPFVSDANWRVYTVNYYVNGARHSDIRVRSKYTVGFVPAQPPGTLTDLYRVKITL